MLTVVENQQTVPVTQCVDQGGGWFGCRRGCASYDREGLERHQFGPPQPSELDTPHAVPEPIDPGIGGFDRESSLSDPGWSDQCHQAMAGQQPSQCGHGGVATHERVPPQWQIVARATRSQVGGRGRELTPVLGTELGEES